MSSQCAPLSFSIVRLIKCDQSRSKVEEGRLRKTMLPSMHPDKSMSADSGYLRSGLTANSQDMNYQGSTCICRVPKAQVREGTVVECVHCGASQPDIRPYSTSNPQRQVAVAVVLTHNPTM